MKVLFFLLSLLLFSCASKPYTKQQGLPAAIGSAREEIYVIEQGEQRLLQRKEMVFSRQGRIKQSKTFDAAGVLLQQTKKKLWFVVVNYPDKEAYYCKTRWKPNQRERISCYTQKQFKQNERIQHYNSDGSIAKIVDHFEPFHSQYFYYSNGELSSILIRDKNSELVDEIVVKCTSKDAKGSCLEENRYWSSSGKHQLIRLFPKYE